MCILDSLCYEVDCLDEKDLQVLRALIGLYNKQKEEKAKLLDLYNNRVQEILELEQNSISKDKIRDKILELEEYQKQHKEGNWADIPIEDYDFDKINLLKELLEEK